MMMMHFLKESVPIGCANTQLAVYNAFHKAFQYALVLLEQATTIKIATRSNRGTGPKGRLS